MNWFMIGAILAGLGVAAGAFGAHGLEGRVEPDLLVVFETGVRYHIIHALGLLAIGLTGAGKRADAFVGSARARWFNRAGWLFFSGIVLFSGSLYLLALTGERWLGAVTPLGGIGFLLGWAALAGGARLPRRGSE